MTSEFVRLARKWSISLTYQEVERSNQLRYADLEIREIKKHWHHLMREKRVPKCIWDFCLIHVVKLMQFIPRPHQGRSCYKEVTGRAPDISEYCDFEFWDLV